MRRHGIKQTVGWHRTLKLRCFVTFLSFCTGFFSAYLANKTCNLLSVIHKLKNVLNLVVDAGLQGGPKSDTQTYFGDKFGNPAPILTILSLLQAEIYGA